MGRPTSFITALKKLIAKEVREQTGAAFSLEPRKTKRVEEPEREVAAQKGGRTQVRVGFRA